MPQHHNGVGGVCAGVLLQGQGKENEQQARTSNFEDFIKHKGRKCKVVYIPHPDCTTFSQKAFCLWCEPAHVQLLKSQITLHFFAASEKHQRIVINVCSKF